MVPTISLESLWVSCKMRQKYWMILLWLHPVKPILIGLNTKQSDRPVPDYACQGTTHPTTECEGLVDRSYQEISELAYQNSVCFRCLKPGHCATKCNTPACCAVSGRSHPTVLHNKFRQSKQQQRNAEPEMKPVQLAIEDAMASSRTTGTTKSKASKMNSMVLPVWVSHKSNPKKVLRYALLDTMSDSTWITEAVAESIGTPGSPYSS